MGAPASVRDSIMSDEAGAFADAKYLMKWASPGMRESNPDGSLALQLFQEDYKHRVEHVKAKKEEWERELGAEILALQKDLEEWA